MKKLLLKRFLAFGIDYLIVVLHALLLFGMTTLNKSETLPPIKGQLIGFTLLTFPVFMYFYLTERSKSKATVGKRIMKITVNNERDDFKRNVLLRNIVKFLPWEIAHIGVHWTVFYSTNKLDSPTWVWVTLILPQVIVFVYIISMFIYKGESSIYDRISNTKIEVNNRTIIDKKS